MWRLYLWKRLRLLLIATSILAVVSFMMPNRGAQSGNVGLQPSSGPESTTGYDVTANSTRPPYDVLINGYMRAGSSFMGQLLGFQPDLFYWYEPLWNFHSAWYYLGSDQLCHGRRICLPIRTINRFNIEKMQDLLTEIYTCTFSWITMAVNDTLTPVHSGDAWQPYMSCRYQGETMETCLDRLEDTCRQAKHRVTKIIRSTVDNLDTVLYRRPNLKLIHLLRDPRAIINSRVTTTWFNLDDVNGSVNETDFRGEVHDLCKRMSYDVTASIRLKRTFPNRFALVMYEDLLENVHQNAHILYDYFGMDTQNLDSKLQNITKNLRRDHPRYVAKSSTDYAVWWRKRMNFKAIQIVQNTCGPLLKRLGYRIFDSKKEVHDMFIPGYHFKHPLKIEHLDKNLLYDSL